MLGKPKRNVTTSAWCNSRSRGYCKNRRLYCQSREHRRLPISKRIWPQRNFSLLQRNGRRLRIRLVRVEQPSQGLRREQRKRVASIFFHLHELRDFVLQNARKSLVGFTTASSPRSGHVQMSAAFARGYGVPRRSRVSGQKTDTSKRRTPNVERRIR